MKKFVVGMLFGAILVYTSMYFIEKHTRMHNELSNLRSEFTKIAEEKNNLGQRFKGELDKIIAERDLTLRNGKFIRLGLGWTASYGDATFLSVYLYLGFLPDGIYNYVATVVMRDADMNVWHYIGAFFYIIFVIALLIFIMYVIYKRICAIHDFFAQLRKKLSYR